MRKLATLLIALLGLSYWTYANTFITNDFRISTTNIDGNADYDAEKPVVVYNATDDQYLVVWESNRVVGLTDRNELYGQLLSNSGTPVGASFQITDMGTINSDNLVSRPKVVYNSTDNQFLVVWEGTENGSSPRIFGQLLSNTGAKVGNYFTIHSSNAYHPNLTYSPLDNNYLVVFRGSDANLTQGSETEILGQFLHNTGAFKGSLFKISDMGPAGQDLHAYYPSCVYNSTDDQYIVAWVGENSTSFDYAIWGQVLQSDGVLKGTNFQIGDLPSVGNVVIEFAPVLAYNPDDNESLVLWTEFDINFNGQVRGQLLQADGTSIGGNFRADINQVNSTLPDVFYSTDLQQYVCTWSGSVRYDYMDVGEREIWVHLISRTGDIDDCQTIRVSEMGNDGQGDFDAFRPNLTYNPTDSNFLVVWQGDDNTGALVDGEFEIYGQFLKYYNTPQQIIVDDDLGVDNGCSPFATITAALEIARCFDTITVTGGSDNTHTESFIRLHRSVVIQGEGKNTTILQANSNVDNAEDGIFVLQDDKIHVRVQKMTIQNGYPKNTGASDLTQGGAFYLNGDSMTLHINEAIINGNKATAGGGIYSDGRLNIVSVTNSEITNNIVTGVGGGICVLDSNSTFSFEQLALDNNRSGGSGGGFYHSNVFYNCYTSFTFNTFSLNNNVCGVGNSGGGIYFNESHSQIDLTNGIITQNTAQQGSGGGLHIPLGTSNLTQCSVVGNTAGEHGGGVYMMEGKLINCTIAQNTIDGTGEVFGGGLYLDNRNSGPIDIINCTITENQLSGTGDKKGAGIYQEEIETNLVYTIVANNTGTATASDGADIYIKGDLLQTNSVSTQSSSLVEECAAINIACPIYAYSTDPNLATIATCNGHSYYEIQLPSDAYNNATIPSGDNPTTDICGNAKTYSFDLGSHNSTPRRSILVVDDNSGVDDGVSPFQTIQAAMVAALSGDTISVTGGTDDIHTESGVLVNKGVTLKGQGQTTTIIRAAAIQGQAQDGVFMVETTAPVVFQDCTIQNGNAESTGNSTQTNGGSVYIKFDYITTVDFKNVSIKDNRAEGSGGGVYIEGQAGSVTFENCVLETNEANKSSTTALGGGVYNTTATTLSLNQCSIYDNTAGASGGGVASTAGTTTTTFINCTVAKNTAGSGSNFIALGGGLYIAGTSHQIINCTIVENTLTNAPNRLGGGLYNLGGELSIINTIIANNSGATTGNDIYNNGVDGFTQMTSLAETCDGNNCPTFSSTSDPNLDAVANCDAQFYFSLSNENIVTGTAPSGNIPSTDICGTNRISLVIGAFETPLQQPLPVELSYFYGEATEQGNQIYWKTASEINNKGFSVERGIERAGRIDWETIGFVNGADNSTVAQYYEFTDATPRAIVNYYRLQQQDFDGHFEYSQTIQIDNRHTEHEKFHIFPNPIQHTLTIQNGQGTIRLYNILGQQLREWHNTNSVFQLDFSEFGAGQYILVLERRDGSVVSERVFKR